MTELTEEQEEIIYQEAYITSCELISPNTLEFEDLWQSEIIRLEEELLESLRGSTSDDTSTMG